MGNLMGFVAIEFLFSFGAEGGIFVRAVPVNVILVIFVFFLLRPAGKVDLCFDHGRISGAQAIFKKALFLGVKDDSMEEFVKDTFLDKYVSEYNNGGAIGQLIIKRNIEEKTEKYLKHQDRIKGVLAGFAVVIFDFLTDERPVEIG